MRCPSDAELVELVEGRLDGPALARVKKHVAGCSACGTFFGGLASQEARGLRGTPTVDEGSTGALEILMARRIVEAGTAPGEPRAGGILGRGASVGRYLVLSLIGRGGMGEVYAAYDPELDRRVALKLLHPSRSTESSRRRMLREARALGKLSHPNVVQVYDVGEHDEDVFVTMELVEGQPLDDWCEGPERPGWQEVLAAYLDAARGLGAAHAKGIVHRDVKPSNILRGKDGRVRVADFGLASQGGAGPELSESGDGTGARTRDASPTDDTLPAPSDSDAAREDRLTATGALVGTPRFMAPEQFDGPAMGPLSDLHSFCTALYQGLYGELPFPVTQGPGSLRQLRAHKKEGPPASPPPGSPVPVWVHRALARGLAPRPEDRYPSMEALAAALRDDPDARRLPRLRIAVAGAAALLLVAVAVVAGVRGAFESPCAHPERQLAGVWDEGVRGRVRAALTGTGRSYAGDTVTRVEHILDGYVGSWTAMRGEVCEASRRGTQRREIVERRDECLDRRLGQVRALAGLFAEKPDVQVLDKAVQAAAGLPPVGSCADAEALTARGRLPEDPALRARVADLEPRVDRLEALHEAGKYKEGLAAAEPLLAEIATVAHAPLRARAKLWVGYLRAGAGDYEGAKAILREAAAAAAEGKDDVLTGTAWARVLFILTERQRHLDEAEALRSIGPTLIARAHDERLELTWLNVEGLLLFRRGKLAEARAAFERYAALAEKVLGPDHPDLASSINNLGLVLNDMGDYPHARAAYERALSIRRKAFGPEHPAVAASLNNLGMTLRGMDDWPEAKARYTEAIALWERTLGPDHPLVAQGLNNLGTMLYALGAWDEAKSALDRSLAIREKVLGEGHIDVAQTLCGIGSLRRVVHDTDGSIAAFRRALAISEKVLGPDHADVAYSLTGLGRALIQKGALDEAQPLLERALKLREKNAGDPALTEPLLGLGELHLARGKPEEAARVFERALALHDPDAAGEIELDLAEALVRAGKDRARAFTLAEEAKARYEHIGHRPGQERVARWLASHPR